MKSRSHFFYLAAVSLSPVATAVYFGEPPKSPLIFKTSASSSTATTIHRTRGGDSAVDDVKPKRKKKKKKKSSTQKKKSKGSPPPASSVSTAKCKTIVSNAIKEMDVAETLGNAIR